MSLLAELLLLWAWLSRPALARWARSLLPEHLTVACGIGVLMNLLLVAALPLVGGVGHPTGDLLAGLLRQLATLAVAAPLMVVARRWLTSGCSRRPRWLAAPRE